MLHLQSESKAEIFKEIEHFLANKNLHFTKIDLDRPWGGFFVIDESDLSQFKDLFFPEIQIEDKSLKLSPKILVVGPNKRLSWQYHFRRSEIWKLIYGVAGIVRSETDHETEAQALIIGQQIRLKQGERHRLIGTVGWGVVAEIWQHTNPSAPSDEDDIVRLQDDFGR